MTNWFTRNLVTEYAIEARLASVIFVFPFILAILSPVLIALPATRDAFIWFVGENHPIELLTFAFFIVGTIIALRLSRRCAVHGEPGLVWVFYMLYGLCLFVVGMEEVAWGQWFFGFETPDAIEQMNAQGELTLHNLRGIQGGSEIYYMVFCVAAVIGIAVRRVVLLEKVAAPLILLPYVAVIAVFATGDLFTDFYTVSRGIAFAFDRVSEVVELLISVAAFLYAWLNDRRFSLAWTNTTVSGHL